MRNITIEQAQRRVVITIVALAASLYIAFELLRLFS